MIKPKSPSTYVKEYFNVIISKLKGTYLYSIIFRRNASNILLKTYKDKLGNNHLYVTLGIISL